MYEIKGPQPNAPRESTHVVIIDREYVRHDVEHHHHFYRDGYLFKSRPPFYDPVTRSIYIALIVIGGIPLTWLAIKIVAAVVSAAFPPTY